MGATIEVEASEISHNVASTGGGGMLIESFSTAAEATIKDTKFVNNHAGWAGAVYMAHAKVNAIRSTFVSNKASKAGAILIKHHGVVVVLQIF